MTNYNQNQKTSKFQQKIDCGKKIEEQDAELIWI